MADGYDNSFNQVVDNHVVDIDGGILGDGGVFGMRPRNATMVSTQECDAFEDAPPRQPLILIPKLQPLQPGTTYCIDPLEESQKVKGAGNPVYLDLGPVGRVTGYDTTGDGFVDSVDTTGDGFVDHALQIYGRSLSEADIVAKRDEDVGNKAREIFDLIDSDNNGCISKFDLVGAMQRYQDVDDFVLPGIGGEKPRARAYSANTPKAFEAVETFFLNVAGGESRIRKDVFVDHFTKEATAEEDVVHSLFREVDTDSNGSLSKHEVMVGVQKIPALASLIFPEADGIVSVTEEVWDKIDAFFDQVAGGKKRIFFEDFAAFYHIRMAPPEVISEPTPRKALDRKEKRVLIFGPGFGRELRPMQAGLVMHSGYQVHWVLDLPNPEEAGFMMQLHIGKVLQAVQEFRPDVVVCGSKGWHYMVHMWEAGFRNQAALMINAHPQIIKLPEDMNIVICHGSNDSLYSRTRESLEALMSTTSFERSFLYWTANSGMLNGGYTRYGDKHDMDSLLYYDTLPRLIDAAVSKCPENEFVFSWRDRQSLERRQVEDELSGDPQKWMTSFWTSSNGILQDVPLTSQEFKAVSNMFFSSPMEPAVYQQGRLNGREHLWPMTRVTRVQRVQNSTLHQGAVTYFKKLEALFKETDLEFCPNVHTRWVWHGTDAWEAIVTDPMTGFQPLVSGSRLASVWGAGTYFARDAKYVSESNLCNPQPDGARAMLLCLISVGIPCLGHPNQKGILPGRNGHTRYKYHSTVDCLSSPEIFITQQPAAAYPAYVVTFQQPG